MQELEYKFVNNCGASLIFLNGFRMPYNNWDKVCDLLTSEHSILRYNRKGVGNSTRANITQSGKEIIEQLIHLISIVKLDPPYVLVGHSLGGIYAEVFARKHPQLVSAVILVDATHPQEALSNHLKEKERSLTIRRIYQFLSTLFDKHKFSELESIEDTVSYLQSLGSFPNIPVSIITGDKNLPFVSQSSHDSHRKYQEAFLELSEQTTMHVLSNSHHFPQISEPAEVANIILKTMSQASMQRNNTNTNLYK